MISACIPAYNEEKNIRRLLESLSSEDLLDEIVVIASGCTDRTVEIARSFEPRVRVLVQEQREGKSSAINLYLQSTDANIIIMESADTQPDPRCIPYLVFCIHESHSVGMVGPRVVPTNKKGFMGDMAHLLWNSIHRLSLEHPKLGEMVAFKHCFGSIPKTSSVDEAAVEAKILECGYQLAYEPRAIVYNKGPDNLRDWLLQRKRIHLGHINLMMKGHKVSSMNRIDALMAVLKTAHRTPRGLVILAAFVAVEAYARWSAGREWKRSKTEQTVWKTASTTKELGS